jgi:hypothetical protein
MRYLAAFDPRKIAYSKGQCHMSISKMNNVRINVGKIAYSKTGWIALLVSSGLAYNAENRKLEIPCLNFPVLSFSS